MFAMGSLRIGPQIFCCSEDGGRAIDGSSSTGLKKMHVDWTLCVVWCEQGFPGLTMVPNHNAFLRLFTPNSLSVFGDDDHTSPRGMLSAPEWPARHGPAAETTWEIGHLDGILSSCIDLQGHPNSIRKNLQGVT